ncbi:MAG: SsrA-binding protein SmpB [Opitutaceae bacterium]|jgi:SsrA-binding protein|nr:SsrA-binding protein SmpB [Opitutaceae bacterium]
MSAAKANKKDAKRYTEIRNAKALRDYKVEERFEAGIKLQGTEVKAIRAGRAQISDAFGRFDKGDLWLLNAHIDEYAFGNLNNHATRRTRKLLLHKHQLRKIAQALQIGGYALVPLRMYFKESLVKVEVALCTGKQSHDKRDDLRKRTVDLEVRQALKSMDRRR